VTTVVRIPVALPGMSWLPAVLRRRDYWKMVGRWALFGPLIGGAPYVPFIFTIPFIYILGFVPALLAGLLFAAWWFAPGARAPTWPWRLLFGAICGLAAALAVAFAEIAFGQGARSFFAVVVAMHGVPAAMVLALLTSRKPTVNADRARTPETPRAALATAAATAG
jgi:hypothetical protein